MANYGLKYFSEFSSVKGNEFRLEIKQKEYTGSFTSLQASGKPIEHKWENKDSLCGIVGSSINFTYINNNNIHPMNIFYSEDDYEYKAILYHLNAPLQSKPIFEGFLNVDDCAEIETQQAHEVTLSFTDGLGLLKKISIKEPYEKFDYANKIPDEKRTLLNIIYTALLSTELNLPLNVFCNIYEELMNVKLYSPFAFCAIFLQTFSNSSSENEYQSCYDVLEKIVKAFDCVLLQSEGEWKIIRWAEKLNNNADIVGYRWDGYYAFPTTVAHDNKYKFGANTNNFIEQGLLKKIIAPNKKTVRKFDYNGNFNSYRNSKLDILGNQIQSTTNPDGTKTTDYEAEYFYYGGYTPYVPQSSFFIRVIRDANDIEILRTLILGGGVDVWALRNLIPIEITKGDKIKFSFSFRAPDLSDTVLPIYFIRTILVLKSVTTELTPQDDGVWGSPYGSPPSFWDSGVTYKPKEWIIVNIETSPAPMDGLLYLWLPTFEHFGMNSYYEYKDIIFDIEYNIAENINAKGQKHTNINNGIIRNNEEDTIFIDDCKRNVQGTLYQIYNNVGSGLSVKTERWSHSIYPQYSGSLQNIVNSCRAIIAHKIRTSLEGNIFGLLREDGNVVSASSLCECEDYPQKIFVPKEVKINYRSEMLDVTLQEVTDMNEPYARLSIQYQFEVLTK